MLQEKVRQELAAEGLAPTPGHPPLRHLEFSGIASSHKHALQQMIYVPWNSKYWNLVKLQNFLFGHAPCYWDNSPFVPFPPLPQQPSQPLGPALLLYGIRLQHIRALHYTAQHKKLVNQLARG